MPKRIIPFTNLSGAVNETYLDYWDGDTLEDGELAFGIVDGKQLSYQLMIASGTTADGTYVIAPGTNPGTARWHLMTPWGVFGNYVERSIDHGAFTDGQTLSTSWDAGPFHKCSIAGTVTIAIDELTIPGANKETSMVFEVIGRNTGDLVWSVGTKKESNEMPGSFAYRTRYVLTAGDAGTDVFISYVGGWDT